MVMGQTTISIDEAVKMAEDISHAEQKRFDLERSIMLRMEQVRNLNTEIDILIRDIDETKEHSRRLLGDIMALRTRLNEWEEKNKVRMK